MLTITYFIDISNFQHEESDEESNSDDEDNLKLDNPEQSTSYHYQTRSKTAVTTIQPTQDVLKIMKRTIYNSLFTYWNEPIIIGLLASLLDPRLKTLSNWDDETCNKAKTELMCQFKELIDSNLTQLSSSGSLNQQQSSLHHSRLHSSIFGKKAIITNPFSELECYLDPIRTPIANDSVNPFEWWAV